MNENPEHSDGPGHAPTVEQYRKAAATVAGWRCPLLLSHARPDGDALGCLLAMQAILRHQGLTPRAAIYEPCPERYAHLPGADALPVLQGVSDPTLEGVDGVIVLDTSAWSQLEPIAEWLRAATAAKIIVDHHATRDDVGQVYLCDESASAAALLVYRWARAAEWELPLDAARAIFIGIATDTGWFRHSNTSSEALRAVADLLESGVNLDAEFQALYLNDTPAMLRARKVAVEALELFRDETISIMSVSAAALTAARATPADLEDAVQISLSVAKVRMSALLVEMPDNLVKCSFRSKGEVDVAQLAANFGGGGHRRAAGVRMTGALEDVRAKILKALGEMSVDETSVGETRS